ncbi:unnamed protein product [Caenorhabditis nigoni]
MEVSDRFKYSMNGICKIPNIPQTIETYADPTNRLFSKWLSYDTKFGLVHLEVWSPVFSRENWFALYVALNEGPTIPPKTPVFLNILSKNPKFENKYKIETFVMGSKPVRGPEIPFMTVFDAKNGFLDEDGAMTFEYGFHFDSVFDEKQSIWKFNLKCKIFDGESKKNMITYEKGIELLYSHKKLILFHDSQSKIYDASQPADFLEIPKNMKIKIYEKFLQIAHGVQLTLDVQELLDVVYIAHEYKIQNVSKYCERQLLMNILKFSEDDFRIFFPKKSHLGAISKLIMDAAKFDLNHFLAFLLKYLFENWEIKNPFFKRFNLEEMTNESMKMIVANVLYGEY